MSLTAIFDATGLAWNVLEEGDRVLFRTWLLDHGIDPNRTFRFELHVIDCPLIRVFEHSRDADGRPYCGVDHDHRVDLYRCSVAKRDPYDVLQKTPPPVQPWSATP